MNQVIDIHQDRAKEVRSELFKITERVIQDYCTVADLLYEVWENQYHIKYDYANFASYVESELDIRGRKAHFLVQIAKTVKKLGIEWDQVSGIGWRKTAVIAPMLTQENHDKWIEEAKNCTLNQLNEKVKAEKNGTEEETPASRMSLQLEEEQKDVIEAAVDYIKRYDNIHSKSQALTNICYEWIKFREDS